MRRIVLGSTSAYRKKLMERLGIEFEVERPPLDEERAKLQLIKEKCSPLQLAQGLARLKAESLKNPNKIVIGGDQLVQLEGQILGKPLTYEKAIQQLLSMKNKTHEIITAVCITTIEKNFEFYDISKLTMKNLSAKEIADYVEKDQPLDCAGSYKIEKSGKNLFSRIESLDFTAIEGLPLISLSQILQTLGYETSYETKSF